MRSVASTAGEPTTLTANVWSYTCRAGEEGENMSETVKLAIWIGLVIWNLTIILRDAYK